MTYPCPPLPMEAYTKFGFKLIGKAEEMSNMVRKMIKLVLHLFGFEAKKFWLHLFLVIAYLLFAIKLS